MIRINRVDEHQSTKGIRLSVNKLSTFLSSSFSLSLKMNIDYADKKGRAPNLDCLLQNEIAWIQPVSEGMGTKETLEVTFMLSEIMWAYSFYLHSVFSLNFALCLLLLILQIIIF